MSYFIHWARFDGHELVELLPEVNVNQLRESAAKGVAGCHNLHLDNAVKQLVGFEYLLWQLSHYIVDPFLEPCVDLRKIIYH